MSYVIEGQSRRVGKAINRFPVRGFLYKDQLNLVAEVEGSGNIVAEVLCGTRRMCRSS